MSRGGTRTGAGRKPADSPLVMWFCRVSPELRDQLKAIKPDKIRMELSKIVAAEASQK